MLMTSCTSSYGTAPAVRQPAVAGQFYPASRDSLVRELRAYFREAAENSACASGAVQAVIVPHAGYVFSGATAAKAFAAIPSSAHYDRIFLIGPSHHEAFDSASVASHFDYYATPLGNVKVDTATCKALVSSNSCFCCLPSAHNREHCLEVELPFLQYHLEKMPPIVPIIIGTESPSVLRADAKALKPYFNGRNLFVISSDFSHYPSYADACKVDRLTGQSIMTGSPQKFVAQLVANASLGIPNLATSACGQCAIYVMMLMADGDESLKMHHLGYCNSGDSPYGGHDQVVGYHAFALCREKENKVQGFHLSEANRQELLDMARKSIEARVSGGSYKPSCTDSMLNFKTGAFVTLTEHGSLRGCIGLFSYDRPLWQVVCEMAAAAATEDPRFSAVRASELSDIKVEISVLTPLKRIHDISEFDYGRQGIFIRKGSRSGTFLPAGCPGSRLDQRRVPGSLLTRQSRIGWDGWRDAELYTYEAIIIKEL